ncbi:MAG: ribonuclease HII [Actinobacteria bacterium]|nr:ribonuclease HII [Actinomycetota bacterium]
MVAAKPFRQAGGIEGSGDGLWGDTGDMDTTGLSVKEVRAMLASLREPDPDLLTRLAHDPRVTVRRLAYSALRRGGDLASNEDVFRRSGIRFLAGADEAGRGALAGPLTAAAVMFEPGVVVEGVDDSKALAPEVREALYREIVASAFSISVVFIGPGMIDSWGLQRVNLKALGDAAAGVDSRCECVICDHFSLSGCAVPTFGIPRADATFQSVAAASIVAKGERDRVMISLHRLVPCYGFESNKGYGTEEHRRALEAHGPSRFHRLSFGGVSDGEEDERLWGP